jgi:SOS-response transcriptional repressor LexA
MPRPLTARQRELFEFIGTFSAEHGRSPCVKEMQAAMHYRQHGAVLAKLHSLERRGYIKHAYPVATHKR